MLTTEGGLSPDAVPLLKAVARVLKLHPQSKLRVEDGAASADAIATSKLVEALGELGVAGDRFESLVADSAAPAAPTGAAVGASDAVGAGDAVGASDAAASGSVDCRWPMAAA